MKTIFISLFQAIEFRNIVRTDIYRELVSHPDIKIVFFTDSQAKKEYYQKEFSASNVVYEVIGEYPPAPFACVFHFLKFNLIRTATLDIKRNQQLQVSKNYPRYFFKIAFNRIFARPWIRKIVREIDYWIVYDRFFERYVTEYKPSLVLLAHLFSDIEVGLLREARRQGVRTIGLINSWDKITARCMVRLLPDTMIVHNELIKEDAVRHIDMLPENIAVTGIPHFDYYAARKAPRKDEFYRAYGFDPNDRILLFCPAGTTNYDNDKEMMTLLDSLWTKGRFPANLKMIVRLPPNDHVSFPETHKNTYILQKPGKRFSTERGTDWDMDFKDFKELADTLSHASVVVSYSSTISIDAAVFDKPIINVAINFPGQRSSDWLYQVDHYQPVLKSGAVTLAKSEDELVRAVLMYLENPRMHTEGRARLVREQCGALDGMAGKRVAEIIIAEAYKSAEMLARTF